MFVWDVLKDLTVDLKMRKLAVFLGFGLFFASKLRKLTAGMSGWKSVSFIQSISMPLFGSTILNISLPYPSYWCQN